VQTETPKSNTVNKKFFLPNFPKGLDIKLDLGKQHPVAFSPSPTDVDAHQTSPLHLSTTLMPPSSPRCACVRVCVCMCATSASGLDKLGALAGLGNANAGGFNPNFFLLSLADILGKDADKKGLGGALDVLSPPEVLNVVPVYRPTLKFVTKVLALIGSTGESALARGAYLPHLLGSPSSSTNPTDHGSPSILPGRIILGLFVCRASLSVVACCFRCLSACVYVACGCGAGVVRYLSDFVTETLLPYLSGQTNSILRKILEDKDALTPVQTDRQTQLKTANKGACRGGGAGGQAGLRGLENPHIWCARVRVVHTQARGGCCTCASP
jgi:hypothetical protein